MKPTTTVPVEDIRLGEMETWLRPDREGIFAKLRDERPVSFHDEEDYATGLPDDSPWAAMAPAAKGFWAVTRYDDVRAVNRDTRRFLSGHGVMIADLPPFLVEFLGSIINMDDPRHAELRSIVNRGFTPKMISALEEPVRARARTVVEELAEKGPGDFVANCSAPLPLQVICDMMGVPPSMEDQVLAWSNVVVGFSDPEYVSSPLDIMSALVDCASFAHELRRARIENPADDITTKLVTAEPGGAVMTEGEYASFFILLLVAGNETTRNALSHALKALTDHPDQRDIWRSDFDAVAPTAVEEIVRWATPVIFFRRTATEDCIVGGQEIAAGDKVVMFYNSANRDERHFDNPYRFDVRRSPNDHVGFGGGGPHFCLGAHLARLEIRVVMDELFRRLPDIAADGEPDMLESPFINGIKRMNCTW